MRICIAGGPQVGKTTLARELTQASGAKLWSTDELVLGSHWSAQSLIVLEWLEAKDLWVPPWVIEGVPVIRALRKWLRTHPEGKPCDTLYWRFAARQTRSEGQERLAKGCLAVFTEVEPELRRRGVEIREF